MKIGFIGLGNAGSKLATNLINNNQNLIINDLDELTGKDLVNKGAVWSKKPSEIANVCDIIITCLPSPESCSEVMESKDGILSSISDGKIWLEMSTTNSEEVKRIGSLVLARKAEVLDCPVSGGCHRAATGNISLFAGGDKKTFKKALPILKILAKKILHTGELGSASVLKVATNYLATVNLISICEAYITCKSHNLNLNTVFEAFKISSGNSFVHETEGQVILNGSRDINFTMDLVLKDISLFQRLAEINNIPLELSPLINKIFQDGINKYGDRELSPNIIKRLEDLTGLSILAQGFPSEIIDKEKPTLGYEVKPTGL